MHLEILSDALEFTDSPRALTAYEQQRIRQSSRRDGIKLHREWTRSTLKAAIREVDALNGAPPAQ